MRIAHLSDIHFGKIEQPGIVEALIEEVNGSDVALVAMSGDLTQRARRGEYEAAAAMVEALVPPTIVVPGNHDVYPWWRPVRRLFQPLGRYKRHIGDNLTPTFETPEVAVLGVNSAHGRTVKGGRIDRDTRQAIRDFFAHKDAAVFKVLVVHHHLTKIQALGPHDVARKARRTLDIASEVGVDLILCGHLHISHIEPVEIVPEDHRVVIVSAGTATSIRGRRSNRRTNFYNVVDVGDEQFEIDERRYVPRHGGFVSDCRTRFARVPE